MSVERNNNVFKTCSLVTNDNGDTMSPKMNAIFSNIAKIFNQNVCNV